MSSRILRNDAYDDEVPILIIGGGPSGALMAFMLAQFGGMSKYTVILLILLLFLLTDTVSAIAHCREISH